MSTPEARPLLFVRKEEGKKRRGRAENESKASAQVGRGVGPEGSSTCKRLLSYVVTLLRGINGGNSLGN